MNAENKSMKLFNYVRSNQVILLGNQFKAYAEHVLSKNEKDIDPLELRAVLFDFFSTNEFKDAYYKLASELSGLYGIPHRDFIIQPQPTPRASMPGQHGTSWHTDYWYGHGKDFKTVWVPLMGIVPGSTFDVVESYLENERVLNYYSNNPESLEGDFDLLGSETHQVLPDNRSAFVFDSCLLHGSPKNTSQLIRVSFDFRFGKVTDTSSSKDLSKYLKIDGSNLVPVSKSFPGKYLKYIRGGYDLSTSIQHILIEGSTKSLSIKIAAQEAEIERHGQPMLKKHLRLIKDQTSEFTGIAVASKVLLDDDVLSLISDSGAVVYCALEEEFLTKSI